MPLAVALAPAAAASVAMQLSLLMWILVVASAVRAAGCCSCFFSIPFGDIADANLKLCWSG